MTLLSAPTHPSASPEAAPSATGALRRCACGRKPGPSGACTQCRRTHQLGVQPELRVGEPGDRWEREADRVADRVVRTPAPDGGRVPTPARPGGTAVQATPVGGASIGREAPPEVDAAVSAPGRPLDPGARVFMEGRFGHDFSSVRVHTDDRAVSSAEALGARAYTVGTDVVFGAGEYAPETEAGRHLLAHELTHVLQQGGGDGPAPGTVQRNRVRYIEQLSDEDCAPYLAQYDNSVEQVERQIQGVIGPEAADLTDALGRLRELRAAGRVSCWHISGGLFYASYDNATDNLRLHVNVGAAARSPTTLVHEAIHAVHGARYPRLRRLYGEVQAAGGTENRGLGILLLKWKAWTEYWAYRRQVDFNNLTRDPQDRMDPHRSAVGRRDVRRSIAWVRRETGQEFRPWTWEPPARYRARPRGGSRRRRPEGQGRSEGQRQQPTAPQPKLKVGRPGDRWEREADRVAAEIGRSPRSGGALLPVLQRLPDGRVGGGRYTPPAVRAVLAASGRPLDETTRSDMEGRLGHDFSRVRIHTGVRAAESSASVGARALAPASTPRPPRRGGACSPTSSPTWSSSAGAGPRRTSSSVARTTPAGKEEGAAPRRSGWTKSRRPSTR